MKNKLFYDLFLDMLVYIFAVQLNRMTMNFSHWKSFTAMLNY